MCWMPHMIRLGRDIDNMMNLPSPTEDTAYPWKDFSKLPSVVGKWELGNENFLWLTLTFPMFLEAYPFLIIKEEQNFWPSSKQKRPWVFILFCLSAFGGIGMTFGSSFEKLLLASMKGKVITVCFTFVTVWLAGKDLMLSFYNWEKLSNLLVLYS